MKQDDLVHPQGKLGYDLPDSEESLFELEQYPLFDMELGIDVLGSESLVLTILESLDKEMNPDITRIKENHEKGNWEEVQKLTHKIKGGATYGTVRLYFALLFMERYLKAGHSNCQEALYTEMIRIMGETLDELRSKGIIH